MIAVEKQKICIFYYNHVTDHLSSCDMVNRQLQLLRSHKFDLLITHTVYEL